MSIPLLPPSRPDCALCTLHTRKPRHIGIGARHLSESLPASPGTSVLLIIGQNPGYFEDQAGSAFIGKSGKVLVDAYLRGSHILSRTSCYVTNTCRCYHIDGDGPPTRAYTACRPYLLPDLASFSAHPLTLLCLGAPATTHTHHLAGLLKVTLRDAFASNGKPLSFPAPVSRTVPCFSTFHPAAVLREPNLIHAVADHLALLSSSLSGSTPVPTTPTLVRVL